MVQDFFPIFGVIKNTLLSLTLGCYQEEADEVQFNFGSSVTHLKNFCHRTAVKWFWFCQCKYAPTDTFIFLSLKKKKKKGCPSNFEFGLLVFGFFSQ